MQALIMQIKSFISPSDSAATADTRIRIAHFRFMFELIMHSHVACGHRFKVPTPKFPYLCVGVCICRIVAKN